MADEPELAPEEELEPLAAPAEEEPEQPEAPAPDPIAELASKMGWAPKDQYRGDPDEWKPADEFILASKDINRNLSKELRSVRDGLSRMERTHSQILEDKLAEKDAYWRNVHARAVEEGNVELAERAMTERVTLKQAAPQPSNDMPSETQDFIARHKTWWEGDPLARVRAEEIAASLAQRGVPVPEQLRQVERAIKKEFPEHFPAPAKAPAAVQTSQTRNANVSSRVKGFSDMPSEAQRAAVEFERKHGIKRDGYAKSYWEDAGKSRRVG